MMCSNVFLSMRSICNVTVLGSKDHQNGCSFICGARQGQENSMMAVPIL